MTGAAICLCPPHFGAPSSVISSFRCCSKWVGPLGHAADRELRPREGKEALQGNSASTPEGRFPLWDFVPVVPLAQVCWGVRPKTCLPCAGELAGLRQQMAAAEQKAALDKELTAQKLLQTEREAQASLREQRAAHEEDLQRLQREKVRAAALGQTGEGWVGGGSEPLAFAPL